MQTRYRIWEAGWLKGKGSRAGLTVTRLRGFPKLVGIFAYQFKPPAKFGFIGGLFFAISVWLGVLDFDSPEAPFEGFKH